MQRRLALLLLLVSLLANTRADNLGYSKYEPLIIGLDLDYAPLEYVDQDGRPQGLDVEFTQVLMERLNIPFTYSPNAWENISDDVLEGKVGLAMMVYSPYRTHLINYSRAVFRLYYQIVYRDDSKEEFDVRHLKDKEIAYMESRPVTDTLSRAGARLVVVRDLHKAVRDLSKGKYDAVICFRYQAKYIIGRYQLENLKTEDLTLTPREYCYVSHNQQLIEAINAQLELMEKEGTINRIYGADVASQFGGLHIPAWVWYALAGLVLLALLLMLVMQHLHQRRLRREMERAQRSERMKTIFLGNVSHALRTPLNAIIGFSDVLRSADDGSLSADDRRQLLELINDNGQQLLYFINELLQLSQIESSEMKFNRSEVDVRQVLGEYASAVEAMLAEGVDLRVEGAEGLTACVDANLMRQVTMHLLTNAVKNTPEGAITVSYRKERNGLRIEVRDTGKGLPDNLKENIFGLLGDQHTFTQADGQTPGLGLSICKAIITACRGRISAESAQGAGTTIWYWVPCKVQ